MSEPKTSDGIAGLLLHFKEHVGDDKTGYYGSMRVTDTLIALIADAKRDLRELSKFKHRLEWLHTGCEKDAEGYEWGVARVKFNCAGQATDFLWTASDHSDLDSEIAKEMKS